MPCSANWTQPILTRKLPSRGCRVVGRLASVNGRPCAVRHTPEEALRHALNQLHVGERHADFVLRRSCTDKLRYRSLAYVQSVQREIAVTGLYLRAYECAVCSYYHL